MRGVLQMEIIEVHHSCDSAGFIAPTRVIPFGYHGTGLSAGYPIGLVIVVGLLTMGIAGLSEARRSLALAAPAGAISGFFMWLHHRIGLAGRQITHLAISYCIAYAPRIARFSIVQSERLPSTCGPLVGLRNTDALPLTRERGQETRRKTRLCSVPLQDF